MTQKTRPVFKADNATAIPDGERTTAAAVRGEFGHLADSVLFKDEQSVEVQGVVGAMFDAGTHEGVAVAYDSAGGSISLTSEGVSGAVVYRGTWDASTGTFPGGGTAPQGSLYRVSVAGTVSGTAFQTEDYLLAIVDNASTSTFAGSWQKIDGSDRVTAVAGLTGDVQADDLADQLVPNFISLTGSRSTTTTDNGADIECTAATAVTLTIAAGTITRGLTVTQMGSGAVTVAGGAGVTISKEADVQAVTNGQYAVAVLKPTSTADTFVLTGSLAAV